MFLIRKLFGGLGLSATPWRVLDDSWNENCYDELMKRVSETKPRNKVEKLNLLVIGPQGYGKSSFINSIASLSVGEKTTVCNVGDKAAGENVTTIHRKYDIPGRFKTFRLLDVRGQSLVPEHSRNFFEDLKILVDGQIKEGYEFKLENSITTTDEYYNKDPSIETRVHAVIIVFDMSEAYEIHSRMTEDIKTIVSHLNKWNIPVSVVLTKADIECICVQDDVENIYHSKKVIAAGEKISRNLGIPKSNIHPVVNFGGQHVKFGWKVGLPLLSAIKACLNTARDHLYNADKGSRLPEE